MTLARSGADWRADRPDDDSCRRRAPVDSLINRVSQAHVEEWSPGQPTPPSAADLKNVGLDKPEFVGARRGIERAVLAIGTKLDDASVYVRDVSKPLS